MKEERWRKKHGGRKMEGERWKKDGGRKVEGRWREKSGRKMVEKRMKEERWEEKRWITKGVAVGEGWGKGSIRW